jgi:hypothetical protein
MQSPFKDGAPLMRHTSRPMRTILCALSAMLGLLVGVGRLSTVYADAPAASATAPSFSPSRVALADFDGDVRPDSASVEGASNDGGMTEYSIELQFTKVGVQSLSLMAPAGGLWIEARDVNGDHAVDLVFATAWGEQPVAVLLNDGHGRFSRAKAEDFPSAFQHFSEGWQFHPMQVGDAFGVLVSSNASQSLPAGFALLLPAHRFACTATAVALADFRLSSHSGRAPPLPL